MTNQVPTTSQAPGTTDSRVDQFRGDVANLDVPVPSAAGETRLLTGGIALTVAGVALIFLGYWGASGTVSVAEQVPYLLSGGAIGLALVIVGAFLIGRYSMAHLFRFWLARLVAEQRVQTDRLIEAIEASNRSSR